MDTELMNVYIQRQNKLIGELLNKNLMLESQLEIAMRKLKSVEESNENKEEQAYK